MIENVENFPTFICSNIEEYLNSDHLDIPLYQNKKKDKIDKT